MKTTVLSIHAHKKILERFYLRYYFIFIPLLKKKRFVRHELFLFLAGSSQAYESRCSRMDQPKFVEDNL